MKSNLEAVLRDEIGPKEFDELLGKQCQELGMKKKDAKKNAFVLGKVIEMASQRRHTSNTLSKIVDRIVELAEQQERTDDTERVQTAG